MDRHMYVRWLQENGDLYGYKDREEKSQEVPPAGLGALPG